MNNVPRSYLRVECGITCYNNFIDFLSLSPNLNIIQNRQEVLDFIKQNFVYYWKTLKDILKERHAIIEYYPRQIFNLAQEKNIIQSGDIWIEYIDLLNLLCEKNTKNKEDIVDIIISKYIPATKKLNLFYNTIIQSSEIKLTPDINSILPTLENKTLQDFTIIGLPSPFIDLLYNFFKSNEEIKKVWLHGSRVENRARYNSDIDLLVDTDFSTFETLTKKLHKLRIPNRIDWVNIHDTTNKTFLALVCQDAKLVFKHCDYSQFQFENL